MEDDIKCKNTSDERRYQIKETKLKMTAIAKCFQIKDIFDQFHDSFLHSALLKSKSNKIFAK